MLIRRIFLRVALAALAVVCVAGPSVASAGETDPKLFVAHLADTAMQTMTGKGIPDSDRASRFRALFTTDVDMHEIGRFVLGRYWRGATAEQQQEFLHAFEDIVVLTWSTRFKDYGGDLKHTVTNATADGEHGFIVESKVDRDRQQPIQLQWRVRETDAGLRVVDLVVEGSSMAITYRSEYASVIQANGGSVDGLLSAMRAKVTQMQAGASTTKSN